MHKGTNTLNKFNRMVSVVDRCVIQQYNTSRVDPLKGINCGRRFRSQKTASFTVPVVQYVSRTSSTAIAPIAHTRFPLQCSRTFWARSPDDESAGG